MKAILNILVLLLCTTISAQNLVLNPDFEDYSACPDEFCELTLANGWYHISGSPAYFNTCGTNGFSLPSNVFGTQQAASGNAYASIGFGGDFTLTIDNIGGQLAAPLVPGQKYFVNFKVSLAESSSLASNRMGIGFSKYKYSYASIGTMPCGLLSMWEKSRMKVYSDAVVTDSLNWTTVAGSFIADSAYSYFSIGYFGFLDSVIIVPDTMFVGYAHYYIDDVCVSTDSMTCLTTGIPPLDSGNERLSIYPIPAEDEITFSRSGTEAILIEIFDILGIKKMQIEVAARIQTTTVNLTEFKSGMYFYRISDASGKLIESNKLIKN